MELEQLALILADYILDLPVPSPIVKRWGRTFERSSYSNWITEELYHRVERVAKNGIVPIDKVISCTKSLKQNMTDYARKNKRNELIFRTAADTLSEIQEVFESMV